MDAVRVVFARSRSLAGHLIRFASHSRWSHVALIDGDDVIEATADRGVIRTPMSEFVSRYADWRVATFPVISEAAAQGYAISRLGKPYDWTWIIGWAMRRKWQDDDSWVCSELVAASLEAGGLRLFRDGCLSRVTPEHLWMLNPPAAFMQFSQFK